MYVYSMCWPSVPRLHECSVCDIFFFAEICNFSHIKISATHFAKGVGVVYMASRQDIKFFHPSVVKFTPIVFFSSPSTTDSSPSISATDARTNFTCTEINCATAL